MCKMYNEDSKYAESENIMMKIVNCPENLVNDQKSKAIYYILTMSAYYKPKINVIFRVKI